MAVKTSFAFSFPFSGQVWQTVADPYHLFLVLEIRDAEQQKISYRLLNLKTFSLDTFSIDKADWWTMIQHLHMPILFLEKYEDPENPSKKNLILYEVLSQVALGTLEDIQFTSLEGSQLIGHVPGDRTVAKHVDLNDLGLNLKDEHPSEIHYPVYYAPGSRSYLTVMDFLNMESGIGCEYFEWQDYIIISYYRRLKTKFERKLLVLKGDVEIYHQVQDEDLKGFASGSFFVVNGLLVFIENGNQINGIAL